MKFVVLLLAASALHFDITDARGKKPSGVTVEASDPDGDGWYRLRAATKSKSGTVVLVWPFDAQAKAADGPEPVPVIVIEPGDARALANARVVAAIAAGSLLHADHATGLEPGPLAKAIAGLADSEDSFAKGVSLLYAKKAADAVDPLSRALRDRERQLTRVPSEIYPAAMLYGRALFEAGKFDGAALAYRKAMDQRPSDEAARRACAEALTRAGKPEAAQKLLAH